MTLESVQRMVQSILPPNMLSKADALTRSRSASQTLAELVAACGPGNPNNQHGYRPTINCVPRNPRSPKSVKEAMENEYLADAYDAAMEACGDDRRAYRG